MIIVVVAYHHTNICFGTSLSLISVYLEVSICRNQFVFSYQEIIQCYKICSIITLLNVGNKFRNSVYINEMFQEGFYTLHLAGQIVKKSGGNYESDKMTHSHQVPLYSTKSAVISISNCGNHNNSNYYYNRSRKAAAKATNFYVKVSYRCQPQNAYEIGNSLKMHQFSDDRLW